MVREGYGLPELNARERAQVWWSLVGRRRRPHLLARLGMSEPQLDAAIDQVRGQRRAVTSRR